MIELITIAAVVGLMGILARLASRYPIDTRGLIDGAIVGDHSRGPQPLW